MPGRPPHVCRRCGRTLLPAPWWCALRCAAVLTTLERVCMRCSGLLGGWNQWPTQNGLPHPVRAWRLLKLCVGRRLGRPCRRCGRSVEWSLLHTTFNATAAGPQAGGVSTPCTVWVVERPRDVGCQSCLPSRISGRRSCRRGLSERTCSSGSCSAWPRGLMLPAVCCAPAGAPERRPRAPRVCAVCSVVRT